MQGHLLVYTCSDNNAPVYAHTLEHYYPSKYKREDVLAFIGPSLFDTFSSMDPDKCEDMIAMYCMQKGRDN